MAVTSGFIKFDPEKISEVSINLENQHKRFIQCMANIIKKSESLVASWIGDSSALYMDKVRELTSQGGEMAKVLLAFSQELASASGIYKAGETQAKQNAESLPTEGVFLV